MSRAKRPLRRYPEKEALARIRKPRTEGADDHECRNRRTAERLACKKSERWEVAISGE
jgi:hypothetical protein